MAEVALITGASGGIGENLARLVAGGRRDVVLVARSQDKLEALAGELTRGHGVSATVIAADLSAPDGADRVVSTLIDRRLTIDMLINNAGVGAFGPFAERDASELLRLVQLNVVTLTMLTRHLLPGMVARRRGRILNVASTAAFQPGPLMAAYYASKAYVLSLSEALSDETRGTGVTVTCLCPGPTRTGFQSRAGMERSRLLSVSTVMDSADVARAGYEAMLAGRALVVPGLFNKLGMQMLRIAPRALVPRIVRAMQAER